MKTLGKAKRYADTNWADEAIGHPQWDSFDSRLGLIGLNQTYVLWQRIASGQEVVGPPRARGEWKPAEVDIAKAMNVEPLSAKEK